MDEKTRRSELVNAAVSRGQNILKDYADRHLLPNEQASDSDLLCRVLCDLQRWARASGLCFDFESRRATMSNAFEGRGPSNIKEGT